MQRQRSRRSRRCPCPPCPIWRQRWQSAGRWRAHRWRPGWADTAAGSWAGRAASRSGKRCAALSSVWGSCAAVILSRCRHIGSSPRRRSARDVCSDWPAWHLCDLFRLECTYGACSCQGIESGCAEAGSARCWAPRWSHGPRLIRTPRRRSGQRWRVWSSVSHYPLLRSCRCRLLIERRSGGVHTVCPGDF
eukprot:COSAG01_NODE_10307_length_2196_cov_56.034812_2_plen_191_part_00